VYSVVFIASNKYIVPHLVCNGNMAVSYLDFRKSLEPAPPYLAKQV